MAAKKDDAYAKTVWKRVCAAKDQTKKKWEEENRVKECYNYWRGEQRTNPTDPISGVRLAQINKIHPEVRNNIPALYYYRPYARLTAAPEQTDDLGSDIEEDTQLLQDTVNHIVRDKRTLFRESTYLALKESHWAFGCVEVGYSAEFVDAPGAPRPPLKEKEDTKIKQPVAPDALAGSPLTDAISSLGSVAEGVQPEMGGGDVSAAQPVLQPPPVSPIQDQLDSVNAEVEALQGSMRSERFFVKHIPAKQVLISNSDMPIYEMNDWVGYWEDMLLEDVKACEAYENTDDLEPTKADKEDGRANTPDDPEGDLSDGTADKIRIYKLWDLRTGEKLVFAENPKQFLMRKRLKSYGNGRTCLKFLRFDIDPNHFFPRPLILSKLDPQDEYNASREYLRKVRNGTVPRYTYDEDALTAANMQKLESGEQGTYVPRKGSTTSPIEPIQQPSYSENAIQTLTLSDKEFADVGGVGNDARIAATKTATQAQIQQTKAQVQDSFDRQVVAEWLADICRELLCLAIDNMSVDRWVAINVQPDSQFAPMSADKVNQQFRRINADILADASKGILWDVVIDIENLSPVSEEERNQKFMQGLTLMANQGIAQLLSVSPELLDYTLKSMGIRSGKQIALIEESIGKVIQMQQQLAAQGQNVGTGVSAQPGAAKPPVAKPTAPTGPGASRPSPPPGPPKPPIVPGGAPLR